MSSDIAISVKNLGKSYQIYEAPRDRLKQFILPRLQKLIGLRPRQYFRDFWALRDLSFEVKKGQTFGIIGRNGSGKSTLLQIIAGTLQPGTGQVEVNGRVAALLELGSGFNPEFSGKENVYLNASVLGLSRDQVDQRFEDIVAFADIGDFINQPVKTYSSGMVVRLAFAVVAHVDADILIVDEALSVGDAFFVQKCMRFLRAFMKKGTLLFVSHDTSAVVNLCSHALLLQNGEIKLTGTPKKVTEAYLADVYESVQGESLIEENSSDEEVEHDSHANGEDQAVWRDMRLDFINTTQYRNDIELFQFNPATDSFGKGDAKVHSVMLTDAEGALLSWVVGGENVKLKVQCEVRADLNSPIIGFQVKDRLGQVVFGDNTYLTYRNQSVSVMAGHILEACFQFWMPVLPVGDYSICIAIADGSQESHVQHHWVHDALVFKSHASVCHGLIGIPMKKIELNKL